MQRVGSRPSEVCDTVLYDTCQYDAHMEEHVDSGQSWRCGEGFQNKESLRSHILQTHTKDSQDSAYMCLVCKVTFVTETALKEHEHTHEWIQNEILKFVSPGSSPECCACGLMFSDVSESRDHYLQHVVSKDTYCCLICQAQFPGEEGVVDLLYHMVTNHGKKTPFECRECGEYCTDQKQLVKHSFSHISKKPYSCCICNVVFDRQYHLSIHMMEHKKDHPFVCTQCGMSFQSPKSLGKHKQYHAGKYLSCEICEQMVTDKNALLDHKARVHSGPGVIKCQTCGIPFSSKMYLSVHMRNTHGYTEKKQPTPYQCSVCNKYCKTALSLKSHAKTHGKAEHVCQICDKGFTSINNLHQHFQVHRSATGEITFENYRKCKYCGKEFSSRKQCAKHMITHTKEKAHVCEVCGRQYGLKASLAKHMVSCHMSEEEIRAGLNCEVCGQRCFSAEGLEQHLASHSVSEDHICVECGDSFMTSKELKGHRKMLHSSPKPRGRPREYPGKHQLKEDACEREGKSRDSLAGGIQVIGRKETVNETIDENRKISNDGSISGCQSASATDRRDNNEESDKVDREMIHSENSLHTGNDENLQIISTNSSSGMSGEIMLENSNSVYTIQEGDKQPVFHCRYSDHYSGVQDVSDSVSDVRSVSDNESDIRHSCGNVSHVLSMSDICCVSDRVSADHTRYDYFDAVQTLPDSVSCDNIIMADHRSSSNEDPTVHSSDLKAKQLTFCCTVCEISFRTSFALRRHMARVHDMNPSKFPRCSLCGLCFTDKAHLQAHIQIHTAYVPVKPEKMVADGLSCDRVNGSRYKCSICDEVFFRCSVLETHVKSHLTDQEQPSVWRFHAVHVAPFQSYMCVHLSQCPKSCTQSYETL